MTLYDKIYEEGYAAYFSDEVGCPYDSGDETELFLVWYDGYNDAYIEEEGK